VSTMVSAAAYIVRQRHAEFDQHRPGRRRRAWPVAWSPLGVRRRDSGHPVLVQRRCRLLRTGLRRLHRGADAAGMQPPLAARAGQFSVHESCCATLLDILIPVVGWIMLVVVNNTVSDVGGELANQVANQEAQAIEPLPRRLSVSLRSLPASPPGYQQPGIRLPRNHLRRPGRKELSGPPGTAPAARPDFP